MTAAVWLIAAAALVAACVAWQTARRATRRLAQLSEMYWELKYQHAELRAEVQRLRGPDVQPVNAPAPTPARPADVFVPLASLRK